jgi:peptidoglycan/LPS O-acetylase OafA/YrhL
MALWGCTYLAVAYGSLVFVVLQHQGARILGLLRTHATEFFAKISYSLYLVHGVVLSLHRIPFDPGAQNLGRDLILRDYHC